MDIRKVDLNLLPLLDVLATECNVTRAAERVFLSQPAMSAALNRLRKIVDDPLLIRSSTGMELTSKAKEIIPPLREALAIIQKTLSPAVAPDPKHAERTFVVGASEYASFVIMPSLARELQKLAPHISLSVVKLNPSDSLEPLRNGAVDLVIAAQSSAGAYIKRTELFTDNYVCIARQRHPRIKGRLSLKQFIECSQLVIREQTGGAVGKVDEMFQKTGKSRKSAVSLPDFLAAPHIIMETEHITTVAHRVARSLARQFPIQILKHPFRKDIFEVSQFWHQRMEADGLHIWFRQQIEKVSRELDPTFATDKDVVMQFKHVK